MSVDPSRLVQARPTPNGLMEPSLFIPAFMEDNQIGMQHDPEYETRLMRRDPTTAEALRYGNWGVFAGQKFKQFARQLHVIRPFEIPLEWTRWVGIDWGFAAPFSVHFFAKHPQLARLYVYREIYQVGLTDPEQAEKIKETFAQGEHFIFFFADPSMWTERTTDLVAKSTFDVYLQHKLLLTKADNDHQHKINKVNNGLAVMYDGLPNIQIFETCPVLIRTLPMLMSDPKNPEDILDGQEDHAFDSFSYGLTNWTPPQLVKADEQQKKPRQQRSPLADIFGG